MRDTTREETEMALTIVMGFPFNRQEIMLRGDSHVIRNTTRNTEMSEPKS